MSTLDFDSGYNVHDLECPWCGKTNAVDYESFGNATNGSESESECMNCEKPLHTVIDFHFTIRKGTES